MKQNMRKGNCYEKDKKMDWKYIVVTLNRNGIYCIDRTFEKTGEYCLYITRADGKSLIDYLYEKGFLDILNDNFEEPFVSFEEFLEINNFSIKENSFGKYIVLRNIENDLIEKDFFEKETYIVGISFLCQLILKLLVLCLGEYIKSQYIYCNNTLRNLGDKVIVNKANEKVFYKKFKKCNILFEIEKELIEKYKKEVYYLENLGKVKFKLEFSKNYFHFIKTIFVLGEKLEKNKKMRRIMNECNPAYIQREERIGFLEKPCYFFPKTKNDNIKVTYVIKHWLYIDKKLYYI